MNILVSTGRSIMLLDTQDGYYQKIDQDKGVYYGISYSNDLIYVGARNCHARSIEDVEKEQGKILLYDFDMNSIGIVKAPFPLRDIHQIQFYKKRLYVICTIDNKLAIFDGKSWFEFFPNQNERQDFNHFNSIFFDHEYLYLTAHNLERTSEVWKFKKPSIINFIMSRIKRKNNQIFLKRVDKFLLGSQAHNIWIDNNELFTCSSAKNSIISSCGFSYITGKYPRGLAVTDKYIFVGLSEISERKDRMSTTSSVIILDRSWQFIKKIEMPREGIVLEIRVPGYKDYCSPYYKGKKINFSNAKLSRHKFPILYDLCL